MAEGKPTLVYFTLHGKADSMRMLLHKAGVDYNDERISFADWPARKASGQFPTGQVPIYIGADGKVYN